MELYNPAARRNGKIALIFERLLSYPHFGVMALLWQRFGLCQGLFASFFAVCELYAGYHFWQLIFSSQTQPIFLNSSHQLEHHDLGFLGKQAVSRSLGAMACGRDGAFNKISRSNVGPTVPIAATVAVEMIGSMPGAVIKFRQFSSCLLSFSISSVIYHIRMMKVRMKISGGFRSRKAPMFSRSCAVLSPLPASSNGISSTPYQHCRKI